MIYLITVMLFVISNSDERISSFLNEVGKNNQKERKTAVPDLL
jgi:hypothetical protein